MTQSTRTRRVPGMSEQESADFIRRMQAKSNTPSSSVAASLSSSTLPSAPKAINQISQINQLSQSNATTPTITLIAAPNQSQNQSQSQSQSHVQTKAAANGFNKPLPPSNRAAGRHGASTGGVRGSTLASAASTAAAVSTTVSMANAAPGRALPAPGIVRRQTVETVTPSDFVEAKIKGLLTWLAALIRKPVDYIVRLLRIDRLSAAWVEYCREIGMKGILLRSGLLILLAALVAAFVHIVQQRRRMQELALYAHEIHDEKCALAEEHAIMKRQMEDATMRSSQLNSREMRLRTMIEYRLEKLRETLGPGWDSVYHEIKLEQKELETYFLTSSEALILLLFDELDRSFQEVNRYKNRAKVDPTLSRFIDVESYSNCPSAESNGILSGIHEQDPDANIRMAKEILDLRERIEHDFIENFGKPDASSRGSRYSDRGAPIPQSGSRAGTASSRYQALERIANNPALSRLISSGVVGTRHNPAHNSATISSIVQGRSRGDRTSDSTVGDMHDFHHSEGSQSDGRRRQSTNARMRSDTRLSSSSSFSSDEYYDTASGKYRDGDFECSGDCEEDCDCNCDRSSVTSENDPDSVPLSGKGAPYTGTGMRVSSSSSSMSKKQPVESVMEPQKMRKTFTPESAMDN